MNRSVRSLLPVENLCGKKKFGGLQYSSGKWAEKVAQMTEAPCKQYYEQKSLKSIDDSYGCNECIAFVAANDTECPCQKPEGSGYDCAYAKCVFANAEKCPKMYPALFNVPDAPFTPKDLADCQYDSVQENLTLGAGTPSSWLLWLIVALVVAALGVYAFKRFRASA